MWRTPLGDRVLKGLEARVFLTGLAYLVDDLRTPEEEVHTGVRVFDKLSPGQQAAFLEDVTHALLRSDIAAPELTAPNEAAVYAVFVVLRSFVLMEADLDESNEVRLALCGAGREMGLRESWNLNRQTPTRGAISSTI